MVPVLISVSNPPGLGLVHLVSRPAIQNCALISDAALETLFSQSRSRAIQVSKTSVSISVLVSIKLASLDLGLGLEESGLDYITALMATLLVDRVATGKQRCAVVRRS